MDALLGQFAGDAASVTAAAFPAADSRHDNAATIERQNRGGRCVGRGRRDRLISAENAGGWLLGVGAPHFTAEFSPATLLDDLLRGRMSALGRLSGEYLLVCASANAASVVIAADLFGTIPLYWRLRDATLSFGTDLRWVAGSRAGIDPQALYDYLFYSVVPGDRSIWSGTEKLPPASFLVFTDGRAQVSRYWLPGFQRPARADRSGLIRKTRETISAAVREVATLPGAGCFLSGGLDSSTVCGFAAQHRADTIPAFNMGFDVPDYDESGYARIAAQRFGLDLHEQRISSKDVADAIDGLVAGLAEPFGNASLVPAFLCATLARRCGVTNLLAGDGGDELYAGNERYQKQSIFNAYQRIPAWLRRAAVDPLATASAVLPGPARKFASYVRQARVPLPDRLFSYNLLVRNDPATVLTPEFLRTVNTQAPWQYARRLYNEPPGGDALDRMLYLDWTMTLTDNDLPKVCTAARLAGIAVHFPMLHPAVVDASIAVPSDWKLTLRELRKFYKEAFADFLPEEIIRKPKHGFGVPVGIWITTDPALRDRVYARLESLRGRGIVQPAFIDDLLRLQRSEHAVYYGALMWTLFMLEEWLLANPAAAS